MNRLALKLAERRRWLIVALLFCPSVVNYLDRQTLSALAPLLREQLNFGTVEYSYVVTAFLAAYTIGFALSGRVLDRVGVKLGVALALAFWSAAGMLHAAAAIAGGWVALAVCRFLLGLGESFNVPGAVKAMLAFFHLSAFLFLTFALRRHASQRAAFDAHLKEVI